MHLPASLPLISVTCPPPETGPEVELVSGSMKGGTGNAMPIRPERFGTRSFAIRSGIQGFLQSGVLLMLIPYLLRSCMSRRFQKPRFGDAPLRGFAGTRGTAHTRSVPWSFASCKRVPCGYVSSSPAENIVEDWTDSAGSPWEGKGRAGQKPRLSFTPYWTTFELLSAMN